jgi:aromatic-L-amino-acid decarboxylase
MRPDELARAVATDRAAGWLPAAVVATVGTTSTTAVDPVQAIADICAREGLWLHVDVAYAGTVALLPEMRHHFAGWERADSVVVNPHKWLFTPFDCSLLLTRRLEVVRAALSLVPEYLRTTGGREAGRDYSELSPQLGRRARGIKMWMLLRYFGLEGLRSRLRLQTRASASRTRGRAMRARRGRIVCHDARTRGRLSRSPHASSWWEPPRGEVPYGAP